MNNTTPTQAISAPTAAHHDQELALDARYVAPAWGWPGPGAGRASHVAAAVEYQATTSQACGLYPYVAGSGSPVIGVPIGRHMLWGEVVCLDPLAWLNAGLVPNPGVMVLGQPGCGKSAITKVLTSGMIGFGTQCLILGDPKPDYTPMVEHLGGQVIRVGHGMDRINPLDAGPLGKALERMSGDQAERVRTQIRGRRLSLMLGLCSLVRGTEMSNVEEVVLAEAIDILTAKRPIDPTVPEVLKVIESGEDQIRSLIRAQTYDAYYQEVRNLVYTLMLLCRGSLQGLFDGPTTNPLKLEAPAVSVDISRVTMAGNKLVAAAMLCTWAYGYAMVDAAGVLAENGLGPRRQFVAVMDELWRALRGNSGLVEHADALTRLNRQKGMASIMITHSLDDFEALPTAEDRAKARGFIDRSATTILAALPQSELEDVSTVVPLTRPEIAMVKSWSAPESLRADVPHPGRGKYLIKLGHSIGLPVELSLTPTEARLYDTDLAIRQVDAR